SAPRVICNGLPRNKPIVLNNGDWLLPSYDWLDFKSAVYASVDQGKTWTWRGGAENPPERNFFENMCIQQADGRIRMLQRNIQESYSEDNGKTWSEMVPL